jgi:hypothetical protein
MDHQQQQQQQEHYNNYPPVIPVSQMKPESEIPAYTIGKPVCSGPDEKCYLAFSDAYGK